MPQDPHGNHPGWAPPGIPTQGSQDQYGALGKLGDVDSQAPEAGHYDPNLLRPADPTAYVERVEVPSGQQPIDKPIDPVVKKEIEQAVTQALTRKGVGGTVVVRGNHAELHGVAETPISIDLGEWVDQWNLLPGDMRDRRADTAAIRLSQSLSGARRSGAGSNIGPMIAKVVGFVAVLALFGGAVWWLDGHGFFGGSSADDAPETTASVVPPTATESPAEAKARVERACEAARSTMIAGGNLGVDLQGWVVELWLARKGGKLAGEAALVEIADKAGDVGVKGPSASTVVDDSPMASLETARVRMSAGFVRTFFASDGRNKMIEVASGAALAVKAEHAALYARCEHLVSRDVGAWYYGSNRANALASLLFAAGAFGQPVAFDAAKHGDNILVKLSDATSIMKPAAIDDLLRLEGGRLSALDPESKEDGPTAIRFPLGGPTRASKVARAMATKLGL
jgi:hypothetical protein